MRRPKTIPVNYDDYAYPVIEYDDGSRWKVEGYVVDKDHNNRPYLRCPTEICQAVCCRVANLRGRVGEGACEFLGNDHKCNLHRMGLGCKPISCVLWPTKTQDVETANSLAERLGLPGRCQLRVVEIVDGDSQ